MQAFALYAGTFFAAVALGSQSYNSCSHPDQTVVSDQWSVVGCQSEGEALWRAPFAPWRPCVFSLGTDEKRAGAKKKTGTFTCLSRIAIVPMERTNALFNRPMLRLS